MRINKIFLFVISSLLGLGCNHVNNYVISSPDGSKHITLIRENPQFAQNGNFKAYLVYGIYNQNIVPERNYVEVGFELGYSNYLINWTRDTVIIYNAKVFEDHQEKIKMKFLYPTTANEADSIKKIFDIDSQKWFGYESQKIVKGEYTKARQ